MPSNLEAVAKLNEILPADDWVAAMKDADELADRLEALRELAWPDLETAMVGPGGFRGTFHGIDGFREAWADWLRPFDTYRVEIEEVLDAGDRVVVLVRHTATSQGSEAVFRDTAAALMTFREGRLARMEFTLDREEALRAARLEP